MQQLTHSPIDGHYSKHAMVHILAHLLGTPPPFLMFSRGDSPLSPLPASTLPILLPQMTVVHLGKRTARSQYGGLLQACVSQVASVGPCSLGLAASLILGTGTESHHCHILCHLLSQSSCYHDLWLLIISAILGLCFSINCRLSLPSFTKQPARFFYWDSWEFINLGETRSLYSEAFHHEHGLSLPQHSALLSSKVTHIFSEIYS